MSEYARGLIPARAGNIAPVAGYGCGGGAHPRSRGEHLGDILKNAWKLGSSPLARGTYKLTPGGAGIGGLIPARAGNISLQGTAGLA